MTTGKKTKKYEFAYKWGDLRLVERRVVDKELCFLAGFHKALDSIKQAFYSPPERMWTFLPQPVVIGGMSTGDTQPIAAV